MLTTFSPNAEGARPGWDAAAADRVCEFFVRFLTHGIGQWEGQPFELLPWQRSILREVFGRKRPDGTRQYRRVYIEVPRKNGKSIFGSGIALYLLASDGEAGAQVYSAACDRDQARIVFDGARGMVQRSPELSKRILCHRRQMTYHQAASFYRTLSADAYRHHGLNAHGIIFDELHAQPNRELWDVLTTSTGARRQPLTIAITTAGYDQLSICWEQHEYARKVAEEIIEDDSFLGVIFGAEKDDDWTDPVVWAKANPSLGVTIQADELATECERAKNSPAYQNTFRRLRLNQWTAQRDRWLNMDRWDACGDPVPLDELRGRRCFGGLDMATTEDLASFVLVFPPLDPDDPYDVLSFFWIPEDTIAERVRRAGVKYQVWLDQRHIKATGGDTIDYRTILAQIDQLRGEYDLQRIAFDLWGSTIIANELDDMKVERVKFRQGMISMSPPTRELLRLVCDRKIRHGGNPVLRWCADNMVVRTDSAGNAMPDKKRSSEKIDGMVALIMALDCAIRQPTAPLPLYDNGVMELSL